MFLGVYPVGPVDGIKWDDTAPFPRTKLIVHPHRAAEQSRRRFVPLRGGKTKQKFSLKTAIVRLCVQIEPAPLGASKPLLCGCFLKHLIAKRYESPGSFQQFHLSSVHTRAELRHGRHFVSHISFHFALRPNAAHF